MSDSQQSRRPGMWNLPRKPERPREAVLDRNTDLDDSQISFLIELIARVDAVFLPCRQFEKLAVVLGRRRRDYAAGMGVAWWGSAGSEADRKAAERLREELAARRLLRVIRRRATKTTGVAPTDDGELTARAAAGLPLLSDSLQTLDRLAILAAQSHAEERGLLWVRETCLADTTYEQANASRDERGKLVEVEERLLPSLLRGWAESGADLSGRVWYAAAGPMAAPGSAPSKRLDYANPLLPPMSEGFRGQYYDAINAARAALVAADPGVERDLGIVPLPASPILHKAPSVTK